MTLASAAVELSYRAPSTALARRFRSGHRGGMTLVAKDWIVAGVAAGGVLAAVALFLTASGWFWLTLAALGIFLCAAALTSGHWSSLLRIAAALCGVVLVAGSTIPWLDLILGTVG